MEVGTKDVDVLVNVVDIHAKSQVCSSKNGWVMEVGTKDVIDVDVDVHVDVVDIHAKSQVCSLKNGWVMDVGTKEDTYIYLSISEWFYSQTQFGEWS